MTKGRDAKRTVKLNPDWSRNEVNEFRRAILDNDGYCPCVTEKSADTRCMCKDFRDKINDDTYVGTCNCGLYAVVEEE